MPDHYNFQVDIDRVEIAESLQSINFVDLHTEFHVADEMEIKMLIEVFFEIKYVLNASKILMQVGKVRM